MAHKKATGSTRLGRDSIAKRLGVKIHDGEVCKKGAILVRQRGSKVYPGTNVDKGGDDTLFALVSGIVRFAEKKKRNFAGKLHTIKVVNVVTQQ